MSPTTTTTTWLATQIETRTGAPLVTRYTTTRRCPKCQAIILTALDHPVACALLVDVDPTPLNAQLELACTLLARDTYRAWPAPGKPGRFELQHRDQWSIRTPPGEDVTVLPLHVCGRPLPAAGTWPNTTPTPNGATDEPPF